MCCIFETVYLEVLLTEGAAAETQQGLKNSLLFTQFIAVSVAYAFLQHMQEPLTFHFVLQKKQKQKVSSISMVDALSAKQITSVSKKL